MPNSKYTTPKTKYNKQIPDTISKGGPSCSEEGLERISEKYTLQDLGKYLKTKYNRVQLPKGPLW